MPKWTGSWDGGRIAEGRHGPVHYIQLMRGGKRYSHCLGSVGDRLAKAELSRFLENPANYLPPDARQALASEEAREAAAAEKAAEIIITTDLIESFYQSMLNGHDDGEPCSPKHAKDVHRYVSEWATGPLYQRDFRKVTLAELKAGLDVWKTARRKRIIALKSFTRYLRKRGRLTSRMDPSQDLECLPGREPTEKEKKEKVYTPEHLQLIYSHMDRQEIRDPFLVRTYTGLHVSEIGRIASGEGYLEPLADGGEIAGKLVVRHKSGQTHMQSINAQTYAALERIQKRGHLLDVGVWADCISLAAKAVKKSTIKIANLRATFVTLARRRGRLVYPAGNEGIPLQLVSQLVGHTDVRTTKRFYDASDWLPMIVIPVALHHDGDPVVPASKGKKKG